MSLDVTTHGAALRAAVDSVLTGNSAWVVFGYVGKTFALQVVSEGRDTKDMFDAFSPSTVMYGYARANKPDAIPSEPAKYVFIYWQGEGAPEKYRINCVQHGDVVKRFCRTVHVTVQARTDDDLDWKDIMSKLAGSAVVGVSPQITSIRDDPEVDATPVGSVYKRTNPATEIPKNVNQRNFWQQQQYQPGPTSTVPPKAKKPVSWVKPVCTAVEDDDPIKARSQALKEARQAEVASVIQSRLKSRVSFDQTNGDSSNSYKKIDPRADIMLARKLSQTSCDEADGQQVGTTWQRTDAKAEIMAARRVPIKQWQPDPTIKVGTNYERPDFQSEIRAARANRTTNNSVASDTTQSPTPTVPSPPSPPCPTTSVPVPTQPSIPPLAQVAKTSSQPEHVETPITPQTNGHQHEEEEEEANNRPVPPAPEVTAPLAPSVFADTGPVAVCLYNYTAGDDDELSFVEGERIFQVQQIDEGWWLGVNAEGQQGLFPANYVELMA